MFNYLLSHHATGEHYRCYGLTIFSIRLHFCARCLGIYLGILGGYITFEPTSKLTCIARLILGPLILTAFDWLYCKAVSSKGNNLLRTLSGLGIGLSFVWAWLFSTTNNNWYFLALLYLIYTIVFLVLLKGVLKNEQSN